MVNQLKTEGLALRRQKASLFAALTLLILGFLSGYLKWPFTYGVDQIFSVVIGDASFQIVSALCVASFVGAGFHERTIQNEIKSGYSRFSILFVRLLFSGLIAVLLHLAYVLGVFAGVAVKYGLEFSGADIRHLWWLLVVFIQTAAIQSFSVFFTFFLKNAPAAMVASVSFVFIVCNIIRNFTDADVYRLSCFSLAQNGETATLCYSLLFAVVTLVLVTAAAYAVFRRADIN